MSQLLGAALPQFILRAPDRSHVDAQAWYSGAAPAEPGDGAPLHPIDVGYVSPWWPSASRGVNNDTGILAREDGLVGAYVWPASGANGRLGWRGVTRDETGAPAPGCTVRVFRVSTGEMQSIVTSDPNTGDYTITTPFFEAHIITVHRSLPLPIGGASVETFPG